MKKGHILLIALMLSVGVSNADNLESDKDIGFSIDMEDDTSIFVNKVSDMGYLSNAEKAAVDRFKCYLSKTDLLLTTDIAMGDGGDFWLLTYFYKQKPGRVSKGDMLGMFVDKKNRACYEDTKLE